VYHKHVWKKLAFPKSIHGSLKGGAHPSAGLLGCSPPPRKSEFKRHNLETRWYHTLCM